MKKIFKYLLNTLPRPVLIRLSYVFRLFAPVLFRGNKVQCTICNRSFSRFLPYGSDRAARENVLCPNCLSLERHRLLWLYLREKTDFFQAPAEMLHIAPEQCFYKRFRKLENLQYLTADLYSPIADMKFDLHEIPLNDNRFDIIMCNHVMEHVENDLQCMKELYRVLKPGGWGIMQVPIDTSRAKTLEDPSIVTPADREKYYWQKDHLRLYGRDYADRLRQAGFEVVEDNFVKTLPAALIEKYRLQSAETIYFLRKQ